MNKRLLGVNASWFEAIRVTYHNATYSVRGHNLECRPVFKLRDIGSQSICDH